MRADTVNYQLELLSWDTRHFGVRMGWLELPPAPRSEPEAATIKAALVDARQQGFRQLMCRTVPRDVALIHALEAAGFRLMDTLVTMALDLGDPPLALLGKVFHATEIREATANDVASLKVIAERAFSDPQIWLDRFHADSRLSRDKQAEVLYVKWVENSVAPPTPADSMADCTFVAEPAGGQIAGFITCVRARGTAPAKVSLNAVDAYARRHGVYRALVHRALEWFREQGEPIVTVRTSVTSVAVQRTWIRFGAVPVQVEHTFHWWAD